MFLLASFLLAGVAGSYQVGDLVVFSQDTSPIGCCTTPWITIFDREGQFKQSLGFPVFDGFEEIAYSREQRAVFLTKWDSLGGGGEVVRLAADGKQTIVFGPVPLAVPTAAPLPGGGLLVATGGLQPPYKRELLRLDAGGNVIDRMDDPVGVASLDVASDGCTAFAVAANRIRRIDICGHRLLDDFGVLDVTEHVCKILPDGGVLAPSNGALVRLDAGGREVARVQVEEPPRNISALALNEDASMVWVGFSGWGSFRPIDVATLRASRSVVALGFVQGEVLFSMAVVGGWNAAEQTATLPQRRRAAR